jgi:hypothetical protein
VNLVVTWLLFPLVAGVLSLGCGLLVERGSGTRLPGVLWAPLGLATIVVASQVTTYWGATARLATPLVVVLAIAGFGLSLSRRRDADPRAWPRRVTAGVDRLAAAAALGVFFVYAAPVVLAGTATFLGYTMLGDDSVHFVLIDWVMKHGHQIHGLAPSSYHATLAGYYATAYPLGAHTALGALRPLVGQDVAWVYQPYLAFIAAMSSLSFYAVLSRVIAVRWMRAVAAFLAAQPGLVYAFALEGSVKELGTVWVLALITALGAEWVRHGGRVRSVLPLAVAAAAGVGLLNVSVLPWIGPLLLFIVAARLWRRPAGGWRGVGVEAAAFVAVTAALSYPSLAMLRSFVKVTSSSLTGGGQFGNLLGPLNDWQILGIWPSGDFRLPPTPHLSLTYVLIGVEIAAVVLALGWVWRIGPNWPLALLIASGIACLYLTARGSPWSDAKTLMIASPAVVLMAMLGPAALWELGRRLEAALLIAAIGFGILWTNALAYHDADLAPRGRLAELATIGSRFAGQGPTLYTDFEEFSKHFLRRTDPSGSGEAWQDNPRAAFVNGAAPPFGVSADLDQLAPSYVQHFRTLVLRRSGSASRPPSNYRLVASERYYEVWQRTSGSVLQHVGLGTQPQPASDAPCPTVRDLARHASRLAFVSRPVLPSVAPAQMRHPARWPLDGLGYLRPTSPGSARGALAVARSARYAVWVGGSFSRGVTVFVDGRGVGAIRRQLGPPGQELPAGELDLSAGDHTLALERAGGGLAPGSGAAESIGAVVLDPTDDTRAVQTLPAAGWRSLCGQHLDWIEALA